MTWNPARLVTYAAIAGALFVCGCGAIIIEHELQADIAIRDEAGRLLPPGEITTVPKTPGMSVLVDAKWYRDAGLEWTFGGKARISYY